MLNKWVGMGRLTRDPELRRTGNGIAVVTFSIAVERDRKTKDGERETDFIDVVAWRNTAEFVSKYFSKGRMAIVEGKIQIRDYTNRDGEKRKAFEIVAENVYFGDSKNKEQNGSYAGEPAYSGDGNNDFQEVEDGEDGDLPF